MVATGIGLRALRAPAALVVARPGLRAAVPGRHLVHPVRPARRAARPVGPRRPRHGAQPVHHRGPDRDTAGTGRRADPVPRRAVHGPGRPGRRQPGHHGRRAGSGRPGAALRIRGAGLPRRQPAALVQFRTRRGRLHPATGRRRHGPPPGLARQARPARRRVHRHRTRRHRRHCGGRRARAACRVDVHRDRHGRQAARRGRRQRRQRLPGHHAVHHVARPAQREGHHRTVRRVRPAQHQPPVPQRRDPEQLRAQRRLAGADADAGRSRRQPDPAADGPRRVGQQPHHRHQGRPGQLGRLLAAGVRRAGPHPERPRQLPLRLRVRRDLHPAGPAPGQLHRVGHAGGAQRQPTAQRRHRLQRDRAEVPARSAG